MPDSTRARSGPKAETTTATTTKASGKPQPIDVFLDQIPIAIETALDPFHEDYVKAEFVVVVRGRQMESVVIAVIGEHCDLEREVNKALLAELIDHRKAVSTE